MNIRQAALAMVACLFASSTVSVQPAAATDLDTVVPAISKAVSGERARDYTMRLWLYNKWSTLPMWTRAAQDARAMMLERGFDTAEVVGTPADGVTKFGDWTNPIGWDCTNATLEVVEPANLPDEYRYLCNYRHNPTSLNNYSCPTPPGGIETELVMLERSTEEALAGADARGKIILVPSGSRGMKRYLDTYGTLGIVSDEIEGHSIDDINENQWLNGWTDLPGGWQMRAADSRNNFGFSISQKKADYLRNLMRRGRTVKVRAVINSRYFTDGSLPYVTGGIRGTDPSGEDVLVAAHMYEWGANDNCAGCAAVIEAIGTINDLIRDGVLPRPKRSIRLWFGFELYGSMAFTIDNLDHLRTKTLAALCCDPSAESWDAATTAFIAAANFNACPSFTDAVLPEVVRNHHARYARGRQFKAIPFASGLDNFFGDPAIGVPLNSISTENGGSLHHNSKDTIDTVDPETLKMLSAIVGSYLYYLADAGESEAPDIAKLAYERATGVIIDRVRIAKDRLTAAKDGAELGKALALGLRETEYYTGLQKDALATVARIMPGGDSGKYLKPYTKRLDSFGAIMREQVEKTASALASQKGIDIVKYRPGKGPREKAEAAIVPNRTVVGTLTLESIPPDKWVGVTSSPRWWSATTWATASYFWCDGERNLAEIRELLELEAGRPPDNFDLAAFYRFLKDYGLAEFSE